MTTIQWPVTIIAAAALIGIYLLSLVLRKKETRKGLAIVHGPLAVIGLIGLILFSIQNRESRYVTSIVLFTLAAIGGFFLIYKDLSGVRVSRPIATAHGLLAAVALILMVV